MKFIFSVLMLLPVIVCQSQDMRIILSAKNEKLFISLNENNSNKIFSLKKTNLTAPGYFTAAVLNEEIDTSWQRDFTIHNAADSVIASLKKMNDDNYCIPLKELMPKLQAGNQYYLYTIALPTDPKKQMLVKVVRRMVCKIAIKN
jgi:hypothetical protein